MNWFMTLQTLFPLFCEASSLEEAIKTFAGCEHIIPLMRDENGKPAFSATPCPPDIHNWLNDTPIHGRWERCIGGWLTETGAFVPVQGTANSRIVERSLIQVPKGTIPHNQGWPNG